MIDIDSLKKEELVWLFHHHCKAHRKQYAQHPNCYYKEVIKGGRKTKWAVLDIETEGLQADYSIIFTYCLRDLDTGEMFSDVINKDDIRKWGKEAKEDTRLVKGLVALLSNYDFVIGHYSSRFDMPFIRTRAIMCGIDFLPFGSLFQQDTWMILRKKFKLSRNTLENGVRQLTGHTRKNHLTLAMKHQCLRGNKKALQETLDHNKRDVLDTCELFKKIKIYSKITKTSI